MSFPTAEKVLYDTIVHISVGEQTSLICSADPAGQLLKGTTTVPFQLACTRLFYRQIELVIDKHGDDAGGRRHAV
jgi:hypothetical protein